MAGKIELENEIKWLVNFFEDTEMVLDCPCELSAATHCQNDTT